ncbi:NAD-dependent epimerase/dehydratase family protein [bacterium]|nr:MAG: NAD-dependent epimerase/dehydratase family protein [bacterium]
MSNPLARDLDHILRHTQGLWDELRGQRIFIAGGTGFFGCWLLESFAWANDKLELNATAVVLTRNLDAFRKKAPHLASHHAIQFHIGDVQSFDFAKGEFSHIIHAATESSAKLNDENPLVMLDTIVEGTRHMLEFARQCGARKFLLTSSGAVYGKQPPDMTHIPEDYAGGPDLADPRSAYGEGKRAAEMLCALYAKQFGLETKIARCFAFVGPYLPLDIHFAIGNFIQDGLAGGPIQVKGDGTPCRSYLYAADLVIWLWTILLRGETCRPYNVGSEYDLTIAELAHIIADCFEPAVEVRIARMPIPSHVVERYVPNTRLAQRELNLRPTVELITSIRQTIQWFLFTA